MTYIIKNDSIITVLAHSINSPRVDMSWLFHITQIVRFYGEWDVLIVVRYIYCLTLIFHNVSSTYSLKCSKRIDGVMVSVITSSTMDRRFEYTVQVNRSVSGQMN
jgi:hypothetical protein